jgi:hypothetical protein
MTVLQNDQSGARVTAFATSRRDRLLTFRAVLLTLTACDPKRLTARRRSSVVEQLIRNQQVVGSIPTAGSMKSST